MVLPFALTNVPASLQSKIQFILQPLLGIELLINLMETLDEDNGMVVVAYINDILIATKASIQYHHWQVGKVFD